jgi:hypothetical protein
MKKMKDNQKSQMSLMLNAPGNNSSKNAAAAGMSSVGNRKYHNDSRFNSMM